MSSSKMEGTLTKWTNYFNGWKERLFLLKGPILYYYYSKNEKPKGKIHMGLASIVDDGESDFFEISTGSTIFFLKAANKEERDRWVKALRNAKVLGEKNIRDAFRKDSNKELADLSEFETHKIDLEQINFAANKFEMDNQSFEDLINKQSTNITQYKILLQRYKEDLENLKKSLKKNADFNCGEQKKNRVFSFNNKDIKENIFYFKSESNINQMKNTNGVQERNRTCNEYNNSVIYSNEEFFDMDENNNLPNANNFNTNNSNGKEERKDNLLNNELILDTVSPIPYANKENSLFFSKRFASLSPIQIKSSNRIRVTKPQTKGKFYDPVYDHNKRATLPVKRKDLSLNIWAFFKSAVGKDLNRFTVPVFWNEPLSSLQKFCEPLQYGYLLNQAAKERNRYLRLCYTAIFNIGQFVLNNGRQTKYFNPLLFETFEYVDNEQNLRYFAEQVSHHPAISAFYAEGEGWNMYGNTNASINFRITGKLDVEAPGRSYVTYTDFSDKVSFTKPTICIRNLIFGKVEIDVLGKFTVANEEGDVCDVELFPCTEGPKGAFKGEAKDSEGNVMAEIGGNWTEAMHILDRQTGEKRVVWKIIPSAGWEYYFFQPYSFDLNYLTEDLRKVLPRTDSRFRPDQRFIESQEIDEASEEKHRLEEKQREAARKRKQEGLTFAPIYFEETYDDLTGELIYLYKGTYWEKRKNKSAFEDAPNIF